MCHLRWLWQPENTRVSVTYNQTYVLHWNPHCCKCPLLCPMHTYTDTCTWHQFIHTRFKTHNRGSLFIQWLIASFSALSKSWVLIPDLLPCGLVNVFSFYCCSTLKEKKIAETKLSSPLPSPLATASLLLVFSSRMELPGCSRPYLPHWFHSFLSLSFQPIFILPSRRDSSYRLAGETLLTA